MVPKQIPNQVQNQSGIPIAKHVYSFVTLAILVLFVIFIFSVVRNSVFGDVSLNEYSFLEISLLLLVAVLAEIIVIYSKQPTAIILLVIGVLLSPSVLHFNIFKDESLLHLFSQLGAIFLLFNVGLHSHFKSIFSKENLIVATCGVILPFIGGFGYATFMGGDFIYSMFLGAALTATSVGVTVAIIKEAGLLKEKFAQVIIGAAVIDDILGLLVLSFVLAVPVSYELPQIFGIFQNVFHIGINPEFTGFTFPILKVLGLSALFLGGGVLFGNWFIKNVIDKLKETNANFLIVLAMLHLYSYMAEFIGLSAIVGAFLAGLLLTNSKHIKFIEDKFYPLEVMFVPIFFISLGLLVNVNDLIVFAIPILVISLIAVLTKLIGCGFGAWISNLKKDALLIGIGMAPRAEVALIVASIGLQRNALHSSEYAIIAAMAFLTAIIPPFFMNSMIKGRVKK